MKRTRPKWRKYAIGKPSQIEAPSPGRVAAARKAVKRDHESVALFPELAKYKSVEERLLEQRGKREVFRARMRNNRAQSWRNARKRLLALPMHRREAALRWFNTLGCPLDPEYLLSMIYEEEINRHRALFKLIERHQLRTRGKAFFGLS